MLSLSICVSMLILALGESAQHNHHNHHGGEVPDSGEVDAAIVNIGLHYNDKLCLELLLVDCAHHFTQGDEKVCGSNGQTYDNHCKFTHAICEFAHSNNHLTFDRHGACSVMQTTTMAATAPPSTTMAATAPPATATSSGDVSTTVPIAKTTGMMATARPITTLDPTTTVDPIHAIIQNVFCQNAPTLTCANNLQIVCGSDGQLYPNQCELSKQICKDPSLTGADMSMCPVPGR